MTSLQIVSTYGARMVHLGILLSLLGSSPHAAASDDKLKGARLEISPEEFDFGNSPQNQKLVHEFTITNTGDEELRIGRISTSCGCTAALPESRTVAPGKSTVLTVTLETRKYRGALERSVSISSSDPGKVTRIKVRTFVERDAGGQKQ